MKKYVIRAAVLFAVLAVIFLACGLWYTRGEAPLTTGDTQMQMDAGEDSVTVYGQLDVDGTLRLEQTFYLSNRTGEVLEEIMLRLYANGNNPSAVRSLSASVNGDLVDVEIDDDDSTLVTIERLWAKDEEIDLTLWTDIQVDLSDRIALIALPVLASFRDGQWQIEPFDPLAGVTDAPQMDGTLDIRYPQEWKAVFSNGTRGMSLAVSKNACVRWRNIGGVAVSAMADNIFMANRLLDCAQTALKSLEAIGLVYPFASLSIVDAPSVSADGDVYSALIVPGQADDKETLIRRITRLIARQTFGVLVGDDAWNEPWLSHTLASTAELLAYRHRKGKAAFETRFFEEIEVATRLTRPYGVSVGAGIDRFGSDSEMTQVLRDQGGAMMLGIGEAIGYDVLAHALDAYARDNAGKTGSRSALEAALESVSGHCWSGYLEDELSY